MSTQLKTYYMSYNRYEAKIVQYATEQAAIDMGVQYTAIEADSYKQAKEIYKERHQQQQENE